MRCAPFASVSQSVICRGIIIKPAAIILDKLMHQERTGGSSRRAWPGVPGWPDDDTLMIHAITERSAEEAYRIRTSRLSIALTSAIFLGSYLSRQFIGDEGEGKGRRGMPEVWLLPTDKERASARAKNSSGARRPSAPRALHCLSCHPALLTRTRFRFYWRNLFGGGTAGPGTHDVTCVRSMFRRCTVFVTLHASYRANVHYEDIDRSDILLLHRDCSGHLDIIRRVIFYL